MDYVFQFGPIKKIYRLEGEGFRICKQKGHEIVPIQRIGWENIIKAGQGGGKGSAYEASKNVAGLMTERLPGNQSEDLQQTQRDIQDNMGYVMMSYTEENATKKKVINLPINVTASIRDEFLKDLSMHLGDRWVGENLNANELKKQIGVPLFYQIKGLAIFVVLMLLVAGLLYLLFVL